MVWFMTQHHFRPIIDLWRPRAELADAVEEPLNTVQAWWNRDSVPSHAYRKIADAAAAKVADGDDKFRTVTLQALLKAAEERAGKPKAGEAA